MLSITVALYCPVLLGAPMRNCDVALLPTSLQCKSRSDVLAWYYANLERESLFEPNTANRPG